MTLSTYNGYEYFEADPEYDDPAPRLAMIEIVPGVSQYYVTFRDQLDVEFNLRGHTYRRIRYSDWVRILRLSENHHTVIEPDGMGMIY